MSSRSHAASTTSPREKSFFEREREKLLEEISTNFEHVLININKLNRNLEGVIAVGNEFSSVEALWSQFESVMAKDPEVEVGVEGEGEQGQKGEQENEGEEVRGEGSDHER